MKHPLSCLKPLALATSLSLAACGGGGSDAPPPPTAVTLSGTAAAGAALVGVVTVKGAKGKTAFSYIEADGNYQVDVSGLTAPYRLRAEGNIGGKRYVLHSYAESAGAGSTVNITPLTDLIIANAAGQIAANFFDDQTQTSLDPAVVKAQEQALRDKLKNVLTHLGVQASVDLLNTAFSADHTGLDAVLDVLRVEVNPATQEAIIRNIVENTQIKDNLQDPQDNTTTLQASPVIQSAVTDIQSILNLFKGLGQAFANGLPQPADIQQYFASNFLWHDLNRTRFLGMLTTDQNNIGLEFANVTVSNLDSSLGTAEARFHTASGKLTSPREHLFYVQKNANNQWELLGNKYTAGLWFQYHCNAPDGENTPAYCGINLNVDDTDPTNNGTTNNVYYGSATVEILSSGGQTNATVYLGTPSNGDPGILSVWDEGQGMYTDDYKGFGNQLGQIDPAVFEAGGSVKFSIYTENLDTTTPASPMIPANAIPVVTYTLPILYAPSQQALLPKFDAATKTAIQSYTPGTDLALSWSAAPGTRVSEILAVLSDDLGQSVEFSKSQLEISTKNSLTIPGSDLSTATLSPNSAYHLLVRLYAVDIVTGQDHSIDYTITIGNSSAGGGTGTTPPPTGTTLTCGYQSTGAVNSFADFEAVVTDCGTATPIAIADIAGFTFTSADGVSQTVFNNDVGKDGLSQATAKTGSNTDLTTGGTINFEWWIEPATCTGCTHSYLVKYTNTTIDPNLAATTGGVTEARETTAILSQTGTTFDLATYTELSITGDMVRSSGSDGEIWNETVTRQ